MKLSQTNKINDLNEELILHYTGFMFGIGCSAFNKKAIDKISILKQREMRKSFIILFDSLESLREAKFEELSHKKIWYSLNKLWPSNVSVLLTPQNKDYEHLSMNSKVAVRIPPEPLLCEFMQKHKIPLITTSINVSSQSPEYDLVKIRRDYKDWFDQEIIPENISSAPNTPSTLMGFEDNKIVILREGSVSEAEIMQVFDNFRVLFVCVGNTCRSPLAEYIAKEYFKNYPEYKFSSAGLKAEGVKISDNSETVLVEAGLNGSDHISKKINRELLEDNHLVLTMTEKNKQDLLYMYPEYTSKVQTFAEFIGEQADISDPYGMDLLEYQKVAEQIKRYMDKLINTLRG